MINGAMQGRWASNSIKHFQEISIYKALNLLRIIENMSQNRRGHHEEFDSNFTMFGNAVCCLRMNSGLEETIKRFSKD